MQRISKYLALASVLNLGVFAQLVVPPAPSGFSEPQMGVQKFTSQSAYVQDKNPPVTAIALETEGSCKFSVDGKKFRSLKKDTELPRKAIVRTGSSGKAELFIKRMGATIRLEPNSEIALERVEKPGKQEHQELNTKVDVRKGKALTVVHANLPGSSLDIKNASGNSLSEPVIGSRYVVSTSSIEDAGPETAPKGDFNPKIAAAIKEQMEFDELQALAETWSDDSNPGLEQ